MSAKDHPYLIGRTPNCSLIGDIKDDWRVDYLTLQRSNVLH
jgi:hypothetical protein